MRTTVSLSIFLSPSPPSVILVELLVPWQKLSLYDVLVFVYMCVSCVVFRISKITLVMMYQISKFSWFWGVSKLFSFYCRNIVICEDTYAYRPAVLNQTKHAKPTWYFSFRFVWTDHIFKTNSVWQSIRIFLIPKIRTSRNNLKNTIIWITECTQN